MSSVFSKEALKRVDQSYKDKVRPEHGESSKGGCMKAVYIGLGSLFGERYGFRGDFHKAFFRKTREQENRKGLPEGRLNTIDRVFKALEGEGIALTEQKYRPVNGKWRADDGSLVDSLEAELIRQVKARPDGTQFYGIAVDGAVHSLLLRIDKAGGNFTVYWMDQFSNGFDAVRTGGFVASPKVTGRLDQELKSFGANPTSVWQLKPEMAASD